MNVIDYKIVKADSQENMHEAMQNALTKGWQPFGGIQFDGQSRFYYQAVVKYGN